MSSSPVASASGNTITVNWSYATNAYYYLIQQRINGGAWQSVATVWGLSQQFAGSAGNTYQYQAAACNDWGCSGYWVGNVISLVASEPAPATPGAPTVSLSGNTINTSWSAVTGATSYRIQQSVNGGSWQAEINKGTTRSHAFSSMAGNSYRYRVRACNASACSAWSAISGSISILSVPAVPTKPTASLTSINSITVSWAGGGGSELPPCHYTGTCHCRENEPCIPLGGGDIPVAAIKEDDGAMDSSALQADTGIQSTGTISYRIQQRLNGGSWQTEINAGTGTSRVFSSLAAGSYQYQVRACNANNQCSAYTAVSNSISIVAIPAAPAKPTASVSANTITASWNAVSGAASYRIQQRLNSGSWQSEINAGTATSRAFTGLNVGNYQYQVRACNANNQCSVYSPVSDSRSVLSVPATPAKPVASITSVNSITVSWAGGGGSELPPCHYTGTCHCSDGQPCIPLDGGDIPVAAIKEDDGAMDSSALQADAGIQSTGTISYRIQQRLNGGSWQTEINAGTGTSRAFTGLAVGNYQYQVRACNANNQCSAYSVVSDARSILATPAAPAKPAASVSGNSITASWGTVSGATFYTIQQRVNGGAWQAEVNAGTATIRAFTGLAVGSYQYQVRACNANNYCSAYSPISDAAAILAVPATPAKPGVSINGNSITISWVAVSGAASYRIQQRLNGGAWQTEINAGTSTSRVFSSLAVGSYQYQVRACNANNQCSAYSPMSDSAAILAVPPLPPIPLASLTSVNGITVSWAGGGSEPPPCHFTGTCHCRENEPCIPLGGGDIPVAAIKEDDGAMDSSALQADAGIQSTGTISYRIQQRLNGGSWQTEINAGTGTNRVFSSLAAGSYQYQVRACNANNQCSAYAAVSNSINVLEVPAVPAAPTASFNGTSLSTNWLPVSGAASYRVQQRVNGGNWSSDIYAITPGYNTTGTAGNSYQYQVKACNANNYCSTFSAVSNQVSLSPVPAIPTGLAASLDGTTINTSWNMATHATAYHIRQSLNGSWQNEINKDTTRVHPFPATPGANHQYQVRACSSSGCSGWSAATVTLTPPPLPAVPPNPTASLSGNNIVVSWVVSTPPLDPCHYTGTCHCRDGEPCIPLGGPAPAETLQLKEDGGLATTQSSAATYRMQGYKDGAVWGEEVVNISGTSSNRPWTQAGSYTFKVRACNSSGCSNYTALSNAVTISQVATPVTTPNGGSHSSQVNVTLSTTTSGATIRYTLNNSAVTASSAQYTAAIALSQSATIRAKAFKTGMAESSEITKVFTIVPPVPSKPQVSGGSGRVSISWPQTVGATTYKLRQSKNGATWQEFSVANNPSCQQNQCVFNDVGAGVYTYQLSACNTSGCSGWSATSSAVTITENGADSDFITAVPAAASVSIPAESAASTSVMTVAGDFTVTNQGAATYNIPITLPAGLGGYTPELALNYSSLGGSGDAGLGWSLAAVSSISRCQKVLEGDGRYQEITFTDQDALCLDGEKLRLVSGTNLRGGAEYRADKQPDVKVVQSGNGASSYFTLYRPNGETVIFGDDAQSRQIDSISQQPYSWLQSVKANLFGQQVEYLYLRRLNYAPLLQFIRYAGNQVEMVYEDRSDASTHYYLGNKLVYDSRIAAITISNHSNQLIRSYHLGYRLSGFSGRSLLETVQMCNGTTSGICSLLTRLDYSDYDMAGFQSNEVVINLGSYSSVQGKSNCTKREMYGSCPAYKLQVTDFDDNGKAELFVSSLHGETGKIFAFEFIGQSFTYQSNKSLLNVDLRPFKYARNMEPIVYHFPWRLIDTNGDGIKEINYGYVAYYDWDGDGVDEVSPRTSSAAMQQFIDENMYSGDYSIEYYVRPYGMEQRLSDFVFDYNGDGLLDRAVPVHFYREMYDPQTGDTPAEFIGDNYVIELNQTNGQHYSGVLVPYEDSRYMDKYEIPGDINGDGVIDYLGYVKTGRNFQNASTSFGNVPSTCNSYSNNQNCLKGLADINGDGKDDIVYVHDKKIYWRQSLSDASASAVQLGSVSWSIRETDPYLWADLNGNDQPELIYFDVAAQKVHIRFDRNTNNEVLDKLISVENGLGKNYAIEYRRLNDSQVYQKGTGAAAANWGSGSKVRDIVSTMPVVARVTEVTGLSQSGQPLNKEIEYSYKGMKTQAGGRGALGFAEVTTEDVTAKTKTIKYFRQDSPFNGMLSKSETFVDGQLAERTTVATWWNLASNNNQSRFVAPRKQQTDNYYLNADYGDISSAIAALTTVVETTFEMTATNYPRVKSTVTTVSDKLDNTSSSQTVSYEYTDEDLANWRIKRPTRTVTGRSRTGQSTISQTADTIYNTNGSVQQVVQEPDSSDASLYLQTFMRYDSKGNLTEQTQCSLHFAQNCGDASVPDTQDNAEKVFRRKIFSYDTTGRYLTKVSNPYYTEQSFHSFNKLGQAQEVRFNQYDSRAGQREYYRYDSFGERYFSYTNQGSSGKVAKQLCSNRSDCPVNAVLAVVMSSPDQPDTITYLDSNGNKVREAIQLLDGRWSLADTLYDTLMRPVKVSKPYINGQTAYYDTLSYDALGRKGAVQSADDLATRFSYYAGKVTQYISGSYSDAGSSASLDRTREEQHNGRGEVSYSTDSLGNNTHFTYTALGMPQRVTGVGGAITSLSYDSYGRRTGMNDPDKGNISYGFNALGEDASRTSPDGIVKTHYRNAVGQIVSTNTVHGATSLSYSFNYANTPFIQQQSHNGSITSYSYDSYHRPFTESYQIDNKSWSRTYYYDEYGRLFRDMDIAGNGYGQQYQYAHGHMNRIFEVKTGQAYYRMREVDAYQNLTQAEAANHIQVDRDYDAKSGRLTGLFAGFGLIQHQYYRYDQLGNLRYRSNLNAFGSADLIESFGYDELNRLETVTFNGVLSQRMTYLDNGNILTKSDVENAATYQYGTKASSCSVTPGVHAVSQIGTRRFCYDARGNQTHRYAGSSLTRRVDYTAFDKPHTIWSNQGESRFNYDATEKLVKRIDKKAGGDMVTYYVGGHEAIYQPDGSSEIKRYIRDIAIHTIKSTGATTLHYVFNDHLGSGSVITDANGAIVETASFDAFGKRRNANSWQGYTNPFSQLPNLAALLNITQKGYTGHIQVDHAAVIHMGGRIYDPELGRFIQADPIVQDPRDAQSLNRYTYVFNNPLSYTDPTGYDCHNQRGKQCNSAIEQQKEDTAKAAQTQGSSKTEDVSKGNQSANLQNAAKVASGQKPTPEQMRELRQLEQKAKRGGRDLDRYQDALGLIAIGLNGSGQAGAVGAGESLMSGLKHVAKGGILGAVLSMSGDVANDSKEPYLYVTYTRFNPDTGQVYAGRTGGYGTPEELVNRRAIGQPHLNSEGFLPPTVDRFSINRHAIRGREQQLIDYYGGARSVGGTARNMINGVADFNPNRPFYMMATRREFGDLQDNSPNRLRLDWK
ncbi:RHS repeat-associated protein [Rheinheimera pacifica]|nr:RHS repeat-associated protein [Rheinheimera pacifica]